MSNDRRWPFRRGFTGLLLLAVTAALFAFGPDAWWWVTHKRVHHCIDEFAGWQTIHRFTGRKDGEVRYWRTDSGVIVSVGWMSKDRDEWAFFSEDGTLDGPSWQRFAKTTPPWTFDFDQIEEPSAPWTVAGLSYREWYAAQYSEPCSCVAR